MLLGGVHVGGTSDPGTDNLLVDGTTTLNDLTVNGTASIAYFETLYETSSIIYSSGSTKFGDTMDDFHDFTGSVDITGSIVASNLSGTNTGDQDLSSYSTIVQLNASSSALQTNIDAKASITQLTATQSLLQTNIDAKVSNSSTASFAITGSDVQFANITASGDISASGDVKAYNFIGQYGTDVLQGSSGVSDSIQFNNRAHWRKSNAYISSRGNEWVLSGNGISEPNNYTEAYVHIAKEGGASKALSLDYSATGNKATFDIDTNGFLEIHPDGLSTHFSGSITASGDISASGDLSALDLNLFGGGLSIKNQGSQSYARFYCESNNAHYTEVKAQPHSQFSGNPTMLLPAYDFNFASPDFGSANLAANNLSGTNTGDQDLSSYSTIVQLNASSSALQSNIDAKISNSSTASFAITGSNVTFANITASGDISASGDVIANNITASNLDISGDVDIDGTLEADVITVNGTALSTVIAATTVANAVNSINTTNANITATTDDASFFVTMVDGATGDQRVESSTKLKFNPSNGNLFVDGFITASGAISASGDITSNTFETISTTLASDSATNVDTFNSSSYNGAIYDYILKDSTVGARAGQFMVAHDDGDVTFTDTSTKHLTDSTIPDITADIDGSDVRVRVTNGNGYTFKSFVKKL